FLKLAGTGAAGLALGPGLWGCATGRTAGAPRVAIVGGGMAGLNAASHLRQAGAAATVYEASDRTGGRMYTARDLLNPGQTTGLGGEFIATSPAAVLALAARFELPVIDRWEETLHEAFCFGGRHYTEEEVVEAFAPLAARIAADYDSTGEVVDFRNEG